MIRKLGVIGTGHIAAYLLEGFNRKISLDMVLANPNLDSAGRLAEKFGAIAAARNQTAVDHARTVIVAVRPADLDRALDGLSFRSGQIVVSVMAGVTLEQLHSLVRPASAVRVLPVSCAAINQSPILMYPAQQEVKSLFSMLGRVHEMPDEAAMTPGTALVGAFYAWMFALMDVAADWTGQQGIDPRTARTLVIDTMAGACGMARHQQDQPLRQIWETLATPGGISRQGAGVLAENDGLAAWSRALETITREMKKQG